MKKRFIRLVFTVFIALGLLAGSVVVVLLYPGLSYAKQTRHGQYTIFHNQVLPAKAVTGCTDEAVAMIERSELYRPELQLDICLDDGGVYTALLNRLRGRAFAWEAYHEVVLSSNVDFEANYAELSGYRWNLVQLLTHEMMHGYQFNYLGLLHSNPVAGLPKWKWEGYPEYVSRQNKEQKSLVRNIDRLNATLKTRHNGWITFEDGSGTVISYYNFWLLIQYCMDIQKMTYQQLLQDQRPAETVNRQMMSWYRAQKI